MQYDRGENHDARFFLPVLHPPQHFSCTTTYGFKLCSSVRQGREVAKALDVRICMSVHECGRQWIWRRAGQRDGGGEVRGNCFPPHSPISLSSSLFSFDLGVLQINQRSKCTQLLDYQTITNRRPKKKKLATVSLGLQ
jgi:hypothetical protein